MVGHYILDEHHEPVEIVVSERGRINPAALYRWGSWMEINANRIVKQEHVGPYWLSTVFLGLNHCFSEDRPPLLFETMVFDEEHKVKHTLPSGRQYESKEVVSGLQFRYSTWAEAVAGHSAAVKQVSEWLARASAEVEEQTPTIVSENE